jgi:hypothetical protein
MGLDGLKSGLRENARCCPLRNEDSACERSDGMEWSNNGMDEYYWKNPIKDTEASILVCCDLDVQE